jgi:4-hydroxythreonine-4-phosphate dehydrogenase
MRDATRYAGVSLHVRPVAKVSQATFAADGIDVYDLKNVDVARLELGKVSAMAGHAAFEAVRTMIELAASGAIAATVTAPIHKEALVAAGHHFPGHTEIFAHFTGTSDFTMMLAAGSLRVVHVSTHVSLRQACDAVTRPRVLKVIELAHDACRRLGIERPLVGVAGLNPHASDGGLFGSEEREHIIPAVDDARARGIDVEGPQPPDTFFAKAVGGAYDICVAMYHDQGHIPVKCVGFKYDAKQRTWTSVNGINVSLGLPIIRTSVDHGTAFDQAGRGTASDASLLDAIEYAARLAAPAG